MGEVATDGGAPSGLSGVGAGWFFCNVDGGGIMVPLLPGALTTDVAGAVGAAEVVDKPGGVGTPGGGEPPGWLGVGSGVSAIKVHHPILASCDITMSLAEYSMPNYSNQVKRKKNTLVNKLTPSQSLESFAIGLLMGVVVLVIAGSATFLTLFRDRIFPGVMINNISVAGKTTEEALEILNRELPSLPSAVVLTVDDISVASTAAELELHYELPIVVNQAYEYGRVGFPLYRLWLIVKSQLQPVEFIPEVRYNQEKMMALANQLSTLVNIAGKKPQATLRQTFSTASLDIHPGKIGRELDLEETQRELAQKTSPQAFLNNLENSPNNTLIITAKVASTAAELSEEQVATAKNRATQLVGRRIIARAEDVRLELDDQTIVSLLQLPDGYDQDKLTKLVSEWQTTVERPAQNAEFSYDPNTLKVTQFQPDKQGLTLDTTAALTAFIKSLQALEQSLAEQTQSNRLSSTYQDTTLNLPITTTQPAIALSDTNNLGIKERIGFGESEYDHSIPSRIHNVALTASRINNYILPPGAEFSFNKALGEVSAATGYRPAYVISQGRTVLGDGGGVCQVSTTVFRAVLNAGLPITKRKQHSYRVSYYELNAKPGIDATVYAGDVDLRFVNDTGHHILIRSEANSENLYMNVELYGTSDGRTTKIVDHEVWDFRPALPSQFIPDPSLPPGTRKQIDWAVGGVKASFKNVVKDKDGNIIRTDEYYSNYIPWSAKYLVGV